MFKINNSVSYILFPLVAAVFLIACETGNNNNDKGNANKDAMVVKEQGSFAAGGTVKGDSGKFDPIKDGAFNPDSQSTAGQTIHGDHAFVYYQVPENSRNLPLVFWHGFGQSMKTWQTTPDGREGFQNIFLRHRYPVYLIDQPRRGEAGRSTESTEVTASPDDQLWFGIFRLGLWPDFYEDVQFSKDSSALNQFFRQMTPDTGPLDFDVNISAVSALFDKIGSGILVTHSQSGGLGWLTAIKNKNIKGIVSFEPFSNFVFPEGEVPDPISYYGGKLEAEAVSQSEFERLTKIPIIIYYGDNIPDNPTENPGQDQWRAGLTMAKQWKDAVNDHGGDVTLVHLPDIGIKGNTHFPMSDLNNEDVADVMAEWLKEKGLDQ